jgi:hypothetical protein
MTVKKANTRLGTTEGGDDKNGITEYIEFGDGA